MKTKKPMYNYFTMRTEQGDGKVLYWTVYRAPVGYCTCSDQAEHYKRNGTWGLAERRDPKAPHAGHRLGNPGARRYRADGKEAHAVMMRLARRERLGAARKRKRAVARVPFDGKDWE